MRTHHTTDVFPIFVHALVEELAEESDDLPEDLLDWTPEEEASWVQQDKIDLYRNEH